ncbi:MAG: DUF4870 domain-containing protein [Planctomycetota bacterium]
MSEATPPPTDPSTPPAAAPTGQQDTVMCVLSYLGILSLIPFFAKKDDPYIQWHAKQGLALAVGTFVLMIAIVIVAVILSLIHWTLAILMNLVVLAFAVAVLALSIIGIVKACGGERWLMPVIGPIVHKTA